MLLLLTDSTMHARSKEREAGRLAGWLAGWLAVVSG